MLFQLEHNLFKNIFNGRKFKRLNMASINDTIGIKKEKIMLVLFLVYPSDMQLQTILMPKMILAKFCIKKTCPLEPFLSYILCFNYLVRLAYD